MSENNTIVQNKLSEIRSKVQGAVQSESDFNLTSTSSSLQHEIKTIESSIRKELKQLKGKVLNLNFINEQSLKDQISNTCQLTEQVVVGQNLTLIESVSGGGGHVMLVSSVYFIDFASSCFFLFSSSYAFRPSVPGRQTELPQL